MKRWPAIRLDLGSRRPRYRAFSRDERYWLVTRREFEAGPFRGMEVVALVADLRIVKTDRLGSARILAAEHAEHHWACGQGIDVSPFIPLWLDPQKFLAYVQGLLQTGLGVQIDPGLQYGSVIGQVTALVDQPALQTFWNAFTSGFPFRDATTTEGRDAALWLSGYLDTLVLSRPDAAVWLDDILNAPEITQPSVVVKLTGTDPNRDGVVLGCHVDTAGVLIPGGDDDASGVATLVEALRAIIASGRRLRGDLYFVFHAAEERGMLGSGQLAAGFQAAGVPLKAMLQFDMTGCPDSPAELGKIYLTDDAARISASLTDSLERIIDLALTGPYGTTRGSRAITAAASDHALWALFGYPTAFPFEASYEHARKHTPQDTTADAAHMVHFARLAVAAAVELAEPT